ncbi:DUF2891 domain-containing protein [Qipengyuania sp. DGS5-3]|uniref:DUF2891 domain-containing protein n=1 Tax=Qipengyuania sp. DGS5-3 TaxID=3349632 RepID=UPI0036D3911C
MELTENIARRFAQAALGHVTREYPHKLDHVMSGNGDVLPPSVLHPVFYGSFDWHSCVHGWWTLLTLRRLYPETDEARDITTLAQETFTPHKLGAELAYLERPESSSFERPYGWAWLLYLHLEATRHGGQNWGEGLEPLARKFAAWFKHYLPLLTYPIRTGTHYNTSFACTLALEWADEFDETLAELIRSRAREWFADDQDCQAWEPCGDEFLSSALSEALLMRGCLPEDEFAAWFRSFLPGSGSGEPATLFKPAIVSDRSDGKIAHLDGLNLSRAWAWKGLSRPDAAANHLDASIPHVTGDYAGEHWLASFALLALLVDR